MSGEKDTGSKILFQTYLIRNTWVLKINDFQNWQWFEPVWHIQPTSRKKSMFHFCQGNCPAISKNTFTTVICSTTNYAFDQKNDFPTIHLDMIGWLHSMFPFTSRSRNTVGRVSHTFWHLYSCENSWTWWNVPSRDSPQ